MKRPYLISLALVVLLIGAALVLTSLSASKKYKFGKSAESIHAELLESDYFMTPDHAKELIDGKDENYIFVDIRNPKDYDNFHIESAVNVPMQRVLDDEYVPYLKDDRIKVLYGDGSIEANQIRLLLTQYGYSNLMVLHGGADYWRKNMVEKDIFKAPPTYDDEKLDFDPKELKKGS